MSSEINRRIRLYRRLRGLKQSELAEMLGKKSSTYSQCEREGRITCEMIIAIAEIFRVDVRILLYGEIPEAKPPAAPKAEFSRTEINIIRIIRGLKPKKRKEVLEYIAFL